MRLVVVMLLALENSHSASIFTFKLVLDVDGDLKSFNSSTFYYSIHSLALVFQ